jgi:hypothetical protein
MYNLNISIRNEAPPSVDQAQLFDADSLWGV